MAFTLKFEGGHFCPNCDLFSWNQPENQQSLAKCGRCHVVSYCGKECQEEHWNKVHRNHCKYLAGIKKAKHSEHRRESCTICIARDSVGDHVFSPANPNYVCIFDKLDWNLVPSTFPHPFPLTGPPEDRIEKMLTVMQRILLKIKETEIPIYLSRPQQFDQIEKKLWGLRSSFYMNRIIGRDQDSMAVMDSIVPLVSPGSPMATFVARAGCRLWYQSFDCNLLATFALVKELMFNTSYVQLESALKSPTLLPKGYRQMSKRERFLEVTDKIIEALDQEVVSHSVLAKIACGGKMEQRCSQCEERVTIQGINIEELPVRTRTAEIVFNPLESDRYICKAQECYDKEGQRNQEKIRSWKTALSATVHKLHMTRCDHTS